MMGNSTGSCIMRFELATHKILSFYLDQELYQLTNIILIADHEGKSYKTVNTNTPKRFEVSSCT
ncbi:hypothetical protein TSUD_150830 [Trifolium subterraneum]|uniref:Uncharacterized protein n=1 Tax=Trifolium subterraneum TaxID=3900 RepID=A0A2Z6LYS1_TRISU|nr:hypothetical protein TSUD_150830 [Trifolium subterraneum]